MAWRTIFQEAGGTRHCETFPKHHEAKCALLVMAETTMRPIPAQFREIIDRWRSFFSLEAWRFPYPVRIISNLRRAAGKEYLIS